MVAQGMAFGRGAWIALASLGSAALLGGALAFQYIGGLYPCHLCLMARWPHLAAMVIGVLALTAGRLRAGVVVTVLALCGALAAATTMGVGIYHTGVERHYWQGPTTCTSGSITGLAPDDLMAQIMAAPVVQCDQVAWALWGISMASWNALFSALLVGFWLRAAVSKPA